MFKRLAVAALLLVPAFALRAGEPVYQIELVPSGKMVSQDLPVLKGTTYVFHQYPTGTLVSVRKSTVKQITKLSPAAAAAANPTSIVPIRDLAMQGPKQSLGGGSSGGRRATVIDRARGAAAAGNRGTRARTTGY